MDPNINSYYEKPADLEEGGWRRWVAKVTFRNEIQGAAAAALYLLLILFHFVILFIIPFPPTTDRIIQ